MLFGLALIILVDLITGIKKRLHQENTKVTVFNKRFWQILSSSGMRATWKKAYEYGVGIIVISVIEGYILKGQGITLGEAKYGITEIAVGIASIIELYSVFENMEAVTGRNLLKRMLRIFPAPIRRVLKKEEENGINKPKI